MSKYIDADALVIDYYDDYETKDDEYTYAYVSKAQIDAAPSIDIVRCGECKYNVGLSNGDGFWEEDIVCNYWDSDGLTADDFCSYGERSRR